MENKRIFIIEDDANILYGLEAQFIDGGLDVETSEGDEEINEILDRLRDFDPGYIILDLILPKVDGFEIIKKIKEDDELSDREVFIFTDLSEEDSQERSLKLGADYIFFKDDFDTYQFAEKVLKIINNQEKEEESDEENYEE